MTYTFTGARHKNTINIDSGSSKQNEGYCSLSARYYNNTSNKEAVVQVQLWRKEGD